MVGASGRDGGETARRQEEKRKGKEEKEDIPAGTGAPCGVHVGTSVPCIHVVFHSKGEVRLRIERRLLIS